jgi:hypothetical protein
MRDVEKTRNNGHGRVKTDPAEDHPLADLVDNDEQRNQS